MCCYHCPTATTCGSNRAQGEDAFGLLEPMEILELCEAARRELHADETLVNLQRYTRLPSSERLPSSARRPVRASVRRGYALQWLPGARLFCCLKVRVRSPVKIFGDIHGQLADLIKLFRVYGCAPEYSHGVL